jgi:hypothetical protein
MEKQWEEMSTDEKHEAQWQKLLAMKDPQGNDLPFQSPEAKASYQARMTRLKDAIEMKKTPDRVPVTILPSLWPVIKAGFTVEDAMYNYDKCTAAYKDFTIEYEPDMHMGAAAPGSGKFLEILDYKLYSWPGHGVAPEHSYQCIEDEYMKPEEYDILLTDPSYFFSNFYLPRVFGALGGWTMLPFLPGILEIYGLAGIFVPYALPPVQQTLKALTEAGAEALKWAESQMALGGELMSLGYVNLLAGGFSKAPFDILGDTLRGTKGIMIDIFKRPDKLLAALDALVPIAISMGVGASKVNGNPLVFMPLHKAADGFLSNDQFKKFFWPTLRKVIIGLIEEGCIPFPALEGHWNSRMEIIQDIPKGKTLWMVDQSDIFKAKETLGQVACLCGNVSSSMLLLSTTDEVRDYCKKLIDTVGRDGGYMMSNGAFFDEAKSENVKAMVDITKEYGVYK